MQVRPGNPTVRPPAVAGLFYPAGPARLRAEVSELLAKAPPAPAGPRPKALIAPHAGYAYSGAVAAAAFATLMAGTPQAVRRVVVIGPSHHAAFRGITAPTAEAFATPLGRMPVDRDALSGLAGLRLVGLADEPHAPEHALEVELPFLQFRLGAFAAVPLLVGDADPQAWLHARPEHRLHMVKVYQHGPGAIRDKDTARRIVGILERHGWLRRLPVGVEVEGKPRRDAWEVVRP